MARLYPRGYYAGYQRGIREAIDIISIFIGVFGASPVLRSIRCYLVDLGETQKCDDCDQDGITADGDSCDHPGIEPVYPPIGQETTP